MSLYDGTVDSSPSKKQNKKKLKFQNSNSKSELYATGQYREKANVKSVINESRVGARR